MKINKVLIANRGEIALRIIRTCKEMGIKTVALCPQKGQEDNFLETRLADEYCFLDSDGSQGYLDGRKILEIARKYKVDAIHPGYGFLAENWKFAFYCNKYKIKFIGPDYNVLKRFEDKVEAKKIAKKIGIPTLPASESAITTKKELLAAAKRIKPPFILKAQRGGGGMGIRVIEGQVTSGELFAATLSIQKQMAMGFSDVDFFLEKYLPLARHIEFQVLSDGANAIYLGERDCTIQRRFQKLIEESPSPFINEKLREEMGNWAVKICKEVKYQGAATVEFLVDDEKDFYFMEVNPRIQVEHPITEAVTGVDIVEQQIKIAQGEKLNLSQKDITINGWAIEVRVNSEDPFKNFQPAPGVVRKYIPAQGQGVFVHSFLHDGQQVYPYFDSLLAKVITWGKTRDEAINKLKRSLDETIIEGVPTTIPFFNLVLKNKDFLKGNFHTNFIEKTGILNQLICDPFLKSEENYCSVVEEEDLANLVFTIYKNIKKEDCKKPKKTNSAWKSLVRFYGS